MAVEMKIDPISLNKLNKRFKLLSKAYPEETFRAIVSILFDIKLLAQKNIKENGSIVTSRLRNSIFVKTPKQKFAKRVGNKKTYNDKNGKSYNSELSVKLRGFEGAVGTNVEYAIGIEKGTKPHKITAKNGTYLHFKIGKNWIKTKEVNHPGSSPKPFLAPAVNGVNVTKWFNKIPEWVESRLNKGR